MKLNLNDTFAKNLPADQVHLNFVRQAENACFSYVEPAETTEPSVIHTSDEMLHALGISKKDAEREEFRDVFSGNTIYSNTKPFAMCYGGHQFGNWAGQLGDGRAINLFELNHHKKQWAVQLKGSGLTPYSRTADGLAVLRSSIREYLCSEAMHHLNVPTTRALSLSLTGDKVLRDILYNGNPAYEKGAIVARVAPTFIRFGSFQILAARKEVKNLKKLTDYTIENFFPHLGKPSKESYLKLLKEVVAKSFEMVVHWERVGFVHGVMNTDNMSILGLTIDYGPYGWLEDYDPNWTPNTTDAGQKRYKFGNQAEIVFWNLYQLANAIYPLIDDVKPMEEILLDGKETYERKHLGMMLRKLGLSTNTKNRKDLIAELKGLLHKSEMDMTLFFRNLSTYKSSSPSTFLITLPDMSYAENFSVFDTSWQEWFVKYDQFLVEDNNVHRVKEMNSVNPKYVLRNYMAQLAIDDADNGNYELIDELYSLLQKPYDEQPEMDKWFVKRPDWAKHKVGCSQLSCSS